MEAAKSILDFALPFFAIAILLGGGFVLFKGSYTKARIEDLEKENAVQAAKIERLERKEEVLETKVEALEREKHYLLSINSQQSNFDAINKKMDQVITMLGVKK